MLDGQRLSVKRTLSRHQELLVRCSYSTKYLKNRAASSQAHFKDVRHATRHITTDQFLLKITSHQSYVHLAYLWIWFTRLHTVNTKECPTKTRCHLFIDACFAVYCQLCQKVMGQSISSVYREHRNNIIIYIIKWRLVKQFWSTKAFQLLFYSTRHCMSNKCFNVLSEHSGHFHTFLSLSLYCTQESLAVIHLGFPVGTMAQRHEYTRCVENLRGLIFLSDICSALDFFFFLRCCTSIDTLCVQEAFIPSCLWLEGDKVTFSPELTVTSFDRGGVLLTRYCVTIGT